MRYLTMVKAAESSGPPPPALMDAIEAHGKEATKAGVLLDTGGLGPTSTGARIRLADGKVTVTDGPFAEAKEVVGGFAFFDVRSLDEAVELGRQFVELHREHWPGWEGEVEVRPVF
jgi:hypothetical protein